MQNLEQVRARNALALSQKGAIRGIDGGEVIKKIPPLIQNHGLLATAAYSFSEKGEGWQMIFDAISVHLSDEAIGIIPSSISDREEMLDFLTSPETSSETLKRATAETMAWLNFARRFVKKG